MKNKKNFFKKISNVIKKYFFDKRHHLLFMHKIIRNYINYIIKYCIKKNNFIFLFKNDINHKIRSVFICIIQNIQKNQICLINTKNSFINFFNLVLHYPTEFLVIIIIASLIFLSYWHISKVIKKFQYAINLVTQGSRKKFPELECGPKSLLSVGINFNNMIYALDCTENMQKCLLSDISYELRIPLTRLKLITALIKRRYGDLFETSRIEIEISRLDYMTKNLFILSRNNMQIEHSKNVLQLCTLWNNVLVNSQFEADQKGKILKIISLPKQGYIIGDLDALENALENIIRNAIEYSYRKISVAFYVRKNQVIIIVDDDGPGIKENIREKIFQPFYKIDTNRSKNRGIGLGLTISKKIILQHHGNIRIDNSPLKGLRLVISIPKIHKKTSKA
ncbi:MAG: ATP-binding protein [Wigglesworthia glossinidia]|nr:ATP-binding protein [Wigglesworthia glossinidia]